MFPRPTGGETRKTLRNGHSPAKFPLDSAAKMRYNNAASFAGLAHSVEHITRNDEVAGSIPASSSKDFPRVSKALGIFFFVLPLPLFLVDYLLTTF